MGVLKSWKLFFLIYLHWPRGLAPFSGFIKLNNIPQNQLANIETADIGMLIYNSDLKVNQFHDRQAWRVLNSKNLNLEMNNGNNAISDNNGLVIGSQNKDPNAILEMFIK